MIGTVPSGFPPIGLPQGVSSSNMAGLIGILHVAHIPVGIGVDNNCFDAKLPACPHDPDDDLSPVGDE